VTRCPDQVNVGAYVLDALEPDERERMQRHLRTCRACAADHDDLAGLPTRLATVPAPDVAAARPPGLLALHRRLGAEPRRRRARAPTVAAALLGVAVTAGVVAVRTADRASEPDVLSAASGEVHAQAALTATRNGTRIALVLGGVPAHEQCRLVGVGRRGGRQTAGTWTAGYDGAASVTGWVSWEPADIERLVVESLDGAALVVLPSSPR
jgi:anti-sigma factor RsiW